MALEAYKKKRDFTKTREPKGRVARAGKRRRFVVQEHHASHLHYDFRLEDQGVLKSWAVPKTPSLDPKVKRLAVEVEDHPLDYADFAGEIPAGEYGAGTVSIWDSGTYEPVKSDYAAGRLEFILQGHKLKGLFALVRMGAKGKSKSRKSQWLLIKMKDAEARRSEMAVVPARAKPAARAAASLARSSREKPAVARPELFEVTHQDKIMFPKIGLSKGDLLAYYERVAPLLLPHLKDRPVTVERLPDGLKPGAPRFWQKNVPAHYPDWIERIALPTEKGKIVNYALINDVQTLLYFVNQGAVTFHTWLSRTPSLDHPDYVLFDLDPGEASWADLIKVAKTVRDVLAAEGMTAVVKTSGKTGLHVLTGWSGDGGYDAARDWAEGVASVVAAELPSTAATEIRKAKRQGRVYIDVMQNARGHHVVPPYVVRATDAATVSVPLAWTEVRAGLVPARFNIQTALRRSKGENPWADLLKATRL